MRPTNSSRPSTINEPRSQPAPGSELELSFTDLLANGQAVGRADGLAVFCFGPLPGERARVRVTARKRTYAVAHLLELLSTSPHRATPFCPVFGRCGGCQVQHLQYEAQLEWKRSVVRETLARIGNLHVDVEPCIGMSNGGRAYRNKMSLVVDRRDRVQFGFYAQRSHDVVPIDGCPIVLPELDRCIGSLAALAPDGGLRTELRPVRHIVARAPATGGRAVVACTTPARSDRLPGAALEETLHAQGIVHSYDLSSQNAILGRHSETLVGRDEIEETIDGIRYRVSPASFFQVNTEIVARIFDALSVLLRDCKRVVDLYCGAATFTLFFARSGCHVVGIEENRHAVAQARRNAKLNGLQRSVRFESAAVEKLAEVPWYRKALAEADAVFLDPPRKGSDEATLSALAEARVRRVWYLSCDPATLARDLHFMAAKGYKVERVQPFDMFPQTGHVEALAQLSLV